MSRVHRRGDVAQSTRDEESCDLKLVENFSLSHDSYYKDTDLLSVMAGKELRST